MTKDNIKAVKSQIKSLQPLQTTQYTFRASPVYIWLTIIVVWLASLLPWNTVSAPDLLLVVLAFWCAHKAKGVGFVAAFVFGFLMDVHNASVLGTTSLTYILVIYYVVYIRKQMMHFGVFGQMLYMLPAFLFAQVPQRLWEAWYIGEWPGWSWIVSGILTCALWLVIHLVLKLPWQPNDDNDAIV